MQLLLPALSARDAGHLRFIVTHAGRVSSLPTRIG